MHGDRLSARRLALRLAFGLALALAPSRAAAWCQMTSSRQRESPDMCLLAMPPETWPLAWRRRCTSVSLSTAASRTLASADVRAILRRSIDTWESVECPSGGRTGLHVEILAETNTCEGATHHSGGNNVHSILFVQEGWVAERDHDAAAYALTLVWHDPRSGEIWDVDVEINEELEDRDGRPRNLEYGDCGGLDRCPDGTVDLQNVLTHEMGHYFGLAHTPDDPSATMYLRAESSETHKRTLQPDDVEGLCTIYAPGILPAACDVTPRGGLGLDCGAGCQCSAAGVPSGRGGHTLGALALALASGLALRSRARRARATPRQARTCRTRPG